MASRMVWRAALRTGPDLGLSNLRGFTTAAALCRRAAPLGPMPNDDIDVSDPKSLKRYDSFTVYLKAAEAMKSKKCWWKTYRQYLKEENGNNDEILVNIGLPGSQSSRSKRVKERYRLVKQNRHNPEMEKASRQLTLKIPVDRVQAEWECTAGPFQLRDVAMHYGVYRDLFPGAFFIPQVILRVAYSNEATSHVHYGNHITPTEALTAPRVTFEADENSLWTLLLTSPGIVPDECDKLTPHIKKKCAKRLYERDCKAHCAVGDEHLQDNEGEYVHWLVGNIPGNAVQSGEELCHYMPPFPAKGTGFHRFIFILFKQDKVIDYEQHSRPSPCYSLKERTFKTLEFYRMYQDSMTPAGLAFFQCQWDESVTNTFHTLLNMKEPIFAFLRPPVYHPPQKVYPHRQPLRYLDRYRDGHVPTYGIY